MLKPCWLLLSTLLLPISAWAFPHADAVPGGLAIIPLGALTPAPPNAQYDGHKVTVVPQNQQWVAIVGIPLSAHAGQHQLHISHGKPLTFEVIAKDYRTQRITIRDKNKVDPDEEMINLLQYQAAYEANAKIITAVDEMIQTLLAM